MIIVSVTATEGGLSVTPRFVDAGEDLNHKAHAEPVNDNGTLYGIN